MRLRDRSIIATIRATESDLRTLTDAELRQQSLQLRRRTLGGDDIEHLIPEVFALVAESAERTFGFRPHDQQLQGGILLARGGIAEMATGEGKTLTATLPLALHALAQRGAHLATANDYLARRDCDWMRPVFERLGITVAALQSSSTHPQRRAAYRCDVTYAAAREFGFDFLRDRLIAIDDPIAARSPAAASASGRIQRAPHFVLIDEVDSILLDEARTPLLISDASADWTSSDSALLVWAAEIAPRLAAGVDHGPIDRQGRVHLSERGRRTVRAGAKPAAINTCLLSEIYEAVERAISVRARLRRDRDYVVRNGEVVIVDEFTGRLGEGRKWSQNVHQAVESQEQLSPTAIDSTVARITVQDLFLRYPQRAGMSGTATEDGREFRRVYGLRVQAVPCHRTVRRNAWSPRLFCRATGKLAAVVAEVAALHTDGRPVLIGTRSIDKSEQLSVLLSTAGIAHEVLNAQREAEEAEIVQHSGEHGRVTVATNMAGRGTDIRLGPGVAELGGLHVIGTEMHESPRIDRQLFGRCARQGDPGSCRQYAALDDELLTAGWGPRRAALIAGQFSGRDELPATLFTLLRIAQKRLQSRHRRARQRLLWVERELRKNAEQLGFDYHLDLFDR